jgi:aspartyl/asparaginyl-tRNA synthetase
MQRGYIAAFSIRLAIGFILRYYSFGTLRFEKGGELMYDLEIPVNLIDPKEFDPVVERLRAFCAGRGFLQVPVQQRLTILSACEDPGTIATFEYAGKVWPLRQTGQMDLEYELLTRPYVPGFWCLSTSYRNEPNPVPGRHDLIFPMFEFEMPGNFDDLKRFEEELLEALGFGPRNNYHTLEYENAAKMFDVEELTARHEQLLFEKFGPVVFLVNFPEHTSPFWNMKRIGGYARKIDVLLFGIETIGSAERSTDPLAMRNAFYQISNGMYADILYAKFGRERVEKELEEFLSLPFFPRCGGGIGITRMIRALKMAELL